MEEHGWQNSAERAYYVLRAMAIRFEFKPGARLNEVELAKQLKMSRAPIREALNRLVSEGLLTWQPNHGFFCRQLRASEIRALYEVRTDLEVGGLRSIIAQPHQEHLHAIAAAWNSAVAQANSLDFDALVKHDEAFHLALAEASGNIERVRLLETINSRLHFVRRINLEHAERREETFREHQALLDALFAGDEATATLVLREHLSLSAQEALDTVTVGLARIYADQLR